MNNRYFQTAKSLNQQLQQLMLRMQTRQPNIARVSFAKYIAETDTLVTCADSEFERWSELHYEMCLSKVTQLKQTANAGVPRIIDDLNDGKECERIRLLLKKGYRSSAAIPCYYQRQLSGFIFINAFEAHAFNQKSLLTLEPYFEMIQFTVESQCQVLDTITKLAERVKVGAQLYGHDSYYHGRRMRLYTRTIAEQLAEHYQFDDEQVEAISLFAQYHDIGKTEFPDSLINNPGRFGTSDLITARSYIDNGIKIVEEIISSIGNPNHPSIQLLKDIMRFQHEYLDGSGYPYGFHADEIPIAARIVGVASVFDAMTTHKSYRQACSVPSSLLELEKMVQQGKLDSECVNAVRAQQNYFKQVILKYPDPTS